MKVNRSISVMKPKSEVYQYWRQFTNFPNFMKNVESVVALDTQGRRSHWAVKAPLGTTVEWDSEIIEDIPDERISWRSVEGSEIDNRGTVEFEGSGQQTNVHVMLSYDPPGGKVGAAVAKILGEEPDEQIREDLERFKRLVETR